MRTPLVLLPPTGIHTRATSPTRSPLFLPLTRRFAYPYFHLSFQNSLRFLTMLMEGNCNQSISRSAQLACHDQPCMRRRLIMTDAQVKAASSRRRRRSTAPRIRSRARARAPPAELAAVSAPQRPSFIAAMWRQLSAATSGSNRRLQGRRTKGRHISSASVVAAPHSSTSCV